LMYSHLKGSSSETDPMSDFTIYFPCCVCHLI
jgi:hypothetical protein